MSKLQQLIEAAKEGRMDNDYNDTIIELCALLEQAEEALNYYDFANGVPQEALAAIKQWKEQT